MGKVYDYGGKENRRSYFRWMYRNILLTKQKEKCCYCQRQINEIDGSGPTVGTLEHLTPRYKSGTDDVENLALACQDCNKQRPNEVNWMDWASFRRGELTVYGFKTLYRGILTEKHMKKLEKWAYHTFGPENEEEKVIYRF